MTGSSNQTATVATARYSVYRKTSRSLFRTTGAGRGETEVLLDGGKQLNLRETQCQQADGLQKLQAGTLKEFHNVAHEKLAGENEICAHREGGGGPRPF